MQPSAEGGRKDVDVLAPISSVALYHVSSLHFSTMCVSLSNCTSSSSQNHRLTAPCSADAICCYVAALRPQRAWRPSDYGERDDIDAGDEGGGGGRPPPPSAHEELSADQDRQGVGRARSSVSGTHCHTRAVCPWLPLAHR